ncbi:MAG: DegT/DnrJ/EryC1/StrS family aminotransferase [Pyrinomonadaceae bacterium]
MPDRNLDFIPVSRPFIWGNESAYVKNAIDEGWISSKGKYVTKFEQAFASFLGVPHAVAASNGTNALHLALSTLGIGQGDEVIVPDFSMISPTLAVLYCGATPVPVDADWTWNINPDLIEEKISHKTRAIIAVHTYGHPAYMPKLMEIARKHSVYVIEDAAEALGAKIEGRFAGSFGDIACFSFYANKTVTTGEGGMLVTSSEDFYKRACWKRDLCFGDDNESRFVHREIGFNYRLTSLQAAFGLAQLEHLDEAIAEKIEIGKKYSELLKDVKGLTLPPEAVWAKNVFWVYGILVGKEFGVSRSILAQLLLEANIESRNFFSPVHRQPIIKQVFDDTFEVSANLSDNGLYLPSFIGMSDETISRVAEAVRKIHRPA